MKSDGKLPEPIDRALAAIEFPGEDERWICSYLTEHGFVAAVMREVAQTHVRLSRAALWGAVALLNVVILVVAGTNPFLVEDVLSLRNELFTFFFSFLGLTLAGCLVGLVLSVDLSRLESLVHQLGREISLDRLKEIFRHPRD